MWLKDVLREKLRAIRALLDEIDKVRRNAIADKVYYLNFYSIYEYFLFDLLPIPILLPLLILMLYTRMNKLAKIG